MISESIEILIQKISKEIQIEKNVVSKVINCYFKNLCQQLIEKEEANFILGSVDKELNVTLDENLSDLIFKIDTLEEKELLKANILEKILN